MPGLHLRLCSIAISGKCILTGFLGSHYTLNSQHCGWIPQTSPVTLGAAGGVRPGSVEADHGPDFQNALGQSQQAHRARVRQLYLQLVSTKTFSDLEKLYACVCKTVCTCTHTHAMCILSKSVCHVGDLLPFSQAPNLNRLAVCLFLFHA